MTYRMPQNTTPRLFADDTCLVIYVANPSILHDNINHELRIVLKWTSANKIAVNPRNIFSINIAPQNNQSYPND